MSAATDKALDSVLDLPHDLPPALADSIRVPQILVNRLPNAVKFTERGMIVGRVLRAWSFSSRLAGRRLQRVFSLGRPGEASAPRVRFGGAVGDRIRRRRVPPPPPDAGSSLFL